MPCYFGAFKIVAYEIYCIHIKSVSLYLYRISRRFNVAPSFFEWHIFTSINNEVFEMSVHVVALCRYLQLYLPSIQAKYNAFGK